MAVGTVVRIVVTAPQAIGRDWMLDRAQGQGADQGAALLAPGGKAAA